MNRKYLMIFLAFGVFLFSCNGGVQNTNQTIQQQEEEKDGSLLLKSLKVQGNEQVIEGDFVDVGKTSLSNVLVEVEAEPDDATIAIEPALEKGIWNIEKEGKHELNILVSKGDKKKSYKVAIEKIASSSLSLLSVSLGAEVKDEIVSTMSFSDVETGIVDVSVKPNMSDAKVAFGEGDAKDEKTYKWQLRAGNNSLKVRLVKGSEEVFYTLKVFSLAKPLNANIYLNGKLISNIEDDFYYKAMNGFNPLFDAGCNCLNLQFSVSGYLGELLINGEKVSTEGDYTKRAIKQIMLKNGEEQIEILLIPTLEAMEKNSTLCLKFKVKGSSDKAKPKPRLIISGEDSFSIEFMAGLEKDEEPLYKVFKSPAIVKVELTGYEYNVLVKEVKIDGEKLELNPSGSRYYATKEIEVEEGKATSVKIEAIPFNENITEKIKWTFALQAGGEKPALQGVKFYAINDEGYIGIGGDLPDAFTEHLRDGSNPLYETDGKHSEVIVGSTTKEIIKEAVFSIDGSEASRVAPKEEGWNALCRYDFNIEDEKPHNIEIEVIPLEEEKWSSLIYKFQLKRSGKKAKLPSDRVLYLQINRVEKDNFPPEIKSHLEDGSNPLLKFQGKSVVASFSFTNKTFANIAKSASFSLDGGAETNVNFVERQTNAGKVYIAEHSFSLPDMESSHVLKMEVIPKDEEHYSRRTFSLRLKSAGKMPLPLVFGANLKNVKDGDRLSIDGEKVTVQVISLYDLMKNVTIGVKETSETVCEIKEYKSQGRKYWKAEKDVILIEGETIEEKNIVIKVEPKDAEQYEGSQIEFFATGKSGKNNAEFQMGKYGPVVKSQTEFKAGCESRFIDDYGSVATTLTLYTVYSKSTVKYAIVGEGGLPLEGESVKTARNNGDGSHTTERIVFFENVPTKVKAWVVAEDGVTQDANNGVFEFDANGVNVKYRYTKPEKQDNLLNLNDFSHKAFGEEIRLLKNDIQSDNMLHLVFGIITAKDDEPFIVVLEDVEEGQSEFVKAQKMSNELYGQCYVTHLNVENLLKGKDQGGTDEMHLKCKIIKTDTGVECFTYKLKVVID